MFYIEHIILFQIPNHDSKSCEQPLAITKRHPGMLSIFSHLKVSFISFILLVLIVIRFINRKNKDILYSIFYPYEIPDEIERS